MSRSQQTTRMTIDIPCNEHKRLKAIALVNGISMRELILGCVRENLLYRDNQPNAQTIKAFEQTGRGEGLVHVKDLDGLFEHLDL